MAQAPRSPTRSVRWIAVAAVAAAALVAVVAVDLRRTVDSQAERARLVAAQDAERTARALQDALRDFGATTRLPESARFGVEGGVVAVRPELAATPEPAFEPTTELDVLALERLRRAACARDAGAALDELEPLRRDPSLSGRARAWIRARMAWTAHRAGLLARRDALLADAGDHAADDPALLLLGATAGTLRSTALADAFDRLATRIAPATARALCDELDRLGLPTAARRARVDEVERRRDTLRRALALEAELVTARRHVARVADDHLVLFWPVVDQGVVLSRAAAIDHLGAAVEPDPLLTGAPFPTDAVPVVDGFVAVRPRPVDPPGLLAGATGTALLITALALLCGGGSFVAFRALRREADALRLRAEFLTTVTHELKTPLAGVRLVAELLLDDHVVDPAERRAWLGRLNGEAARLGVLIENVLDLGRLDRGERPHRPEPRDVAELVADTLALWTPLAERDGFEVRAVFPAGPVAAAVDRDGLQQALINVLDNARKYGRSPLDVAVRRAADGGAAVEVRDHGAGVPPTERETIFERFRRGTAHRHGSTPGVGIGLYLARAILRRHGGDLTCEAPGDGPGARFVFRLPAAEDV